MILEEEDEPPKPVKHDLERYHKMKWCPVPGCLAKPQKKLSNHVIHSHPHVTTEVKALLPEKAKIATATDPKPYVTGSGKRDLMDTNPKIELLSLQDCLFFSEQNGRSGVMI